MRRPDAGEIAAFVIGSVVLAAVTYALLPALAVCTTVPVPPVCYEPPAPAPLSSLLWLLLFTLLATGGFLAFVLTVIQRHFAPEVNDGPPRE